MSESRGKLFKQRYSKYLEQKVEELQNKYGCGSWQYQSIVKQYEFDEREDEVGPETNDRHYDASIGSNNIERLYKIHICSEINFSCAAHCRYCLRQNYNGYVLTDEQIDEVAKYVIDNKLGEILITGGDPFLSPKKLRRLIFKCMESNSLYVIRIATRTFTQAPELVTDEILQILETANKQIRIEVATQIASPVELTWPETVQAFKSVLKLGIPVYSQNVFLKDVNDKPEILIELYAKMREIGISPHYLFNCIPMKGIHHFRPSLKTMIECYERLVNSGQVTGRAKPILALMTSIGKITLTPFNVLEYKPGEYISLKSRYKLSDRLSYNPNWKMPSDAWESEDGYLCIKYVDGED